MEKLKTMRRVEFHTNTNIWLHFENYYNEGVTPEEVKNVLESIRDPYGTLYFYPESSGFNGNWIIQTRATHPVEFQYIVNIIQSEMERLLVKKSVKPFQ